jgi:hypothetical protein
LPERKTVSAGDTRAWNFLTNHAQVLLCIAHDPGIRLRDIGATLGITERRAFGIVADLTEAGYVVKEREGRRSRYQLQPHMPLHSPVGREGTIGELLTVLLDDTGRRAKALPNSR